MQRHPHVQWVLFQVTPQGILARCEACGMQAGPLNPYGLQQFAAAHREHVSAAATHYGAGDVVAAATKALGITPCSPCEARRRALNQALPRVWRR